MKKVFLMIAVFVCGIGAKAQVVSTDYNSVITDENHVEAKSEGDVTSYSDLNVSYSSKNKNLSINMGSGSANSLLYWKMGYSYCFGDYSAYSGILGVGIHKRAIINDNFIFQGILYPYIGYQSYEVYKVNSKGNSSKEFKNEFTYGAAGNIAAGVKLWTTKKGTKAFLTVGYYILAPEFETEGMFDNGEWALGLTWAF